MITLLLPLWLGYALDLVLGDPRGLPHPVVGFGRIIAWGDRVLNHGSSRMRLGRGLFFTLAVVGGTWAATAGLIVAVERISPAAATGLTAVGVFFGLANRTLINEGRAVFVALRRGIDEGRRQLSRIVGRDTAELSPQQIRVATMETLAENLSDGVVAPLFYFALGGLPAMMAYKMINTLDSMIGHRDERHEWFGKTAARVDDVANLIPARITAALMVMVTASRRGGRFVVRYGHVHASPNAGYPEAALAGILDVRFGGPNRYAGEWIDKPWIGENPREIVDAEIHRVVYINHAVAISSVLLATAWLFYRGL